MQIKTTFFCSVFTYDLRPNLELLYAKFCGKKTAWIDFLFMGHCFSWDTSCSSSRKAQHKLFLRLKVKFLSKKALLIDRDQSFLNFYNRSNCKAPKKAYNNTHFGSTKMWYKSYMFLTFNPFSHMSYLTILVPYQHWHVLRKETRD